MSTSLSSPYRNSAESPTEMDTTEPIVVSKEGTGFDIDFVSVDNSRLASKRSICTSRTPPQQSGVSKGFIMDSELIVEPMSTSGPAQLPRPSATASSSPSARRNEEAHSRNSGTGSTNITSGTSATNSPQLQCDWQTILFTINAWVFAVALFALNPLVPRYLSHRTFRLSFMGTATSSLYSLYLLYGKPRAWNLQALQAYFLSIFATKDFIYFLYCLAFVTSYQCHKFALIPILCWSLEHVSKFLRRNFSHSTLYRKYLEELCVWVESNNTTLSILTSHVEIGLGFLLIISLFTWQPNLMQTFLYWQLLKLMYHTPVTAAYHHNVWAKVGRTINPFINRHAPSLNSLISSIQRWWMI
ncbi:transmembrane protein 33-like protein [Senna tora]|uniref:Transmembrane protein 33-like protein n=1 Tax=Senna tora TaxID=362788 RepID=A0A834T7B7_9FABA|nr:transmembrane protein 33-like protein [Senna tora]